MKTLKTMTLCIQDNPISVICPGHVNLKTFNRAFKAEGWSDIGDYEKVEYIYGVKIPARKRGEWKFKQVPPETKGAKPYTWTSWD